MNQSQTSASWLSKVAGWFIKPVAVAAGFVASTWRALRGGSRVHQSPRQARREEKRRRKDLWRKAQVERRKAA